MQKYISEFIGAFVLLLSIVGSGIAGELYTNDQMVILLSHALVIGFTLIILIRIFVPYSGAHFNPIVSCLMVIMGRLSVSSGALYILAQITGAVGGCLFANYLFNLSIIDISTNLRSGGNIYLSEIFATSGLLLIILLSEKDGKNIVSFNVGLYIAAAIIFTSSASFANPAVTIARMFTESFAGIHPSTIIYFIGAQVIGMGVAYLLYKRVFH